MSDLLTTRPMTELSDAVHTMWWNAKFIITYLHSNEKHFYEIWNLHGGVSHLVFCCLFPMFTVIWRNEYLSPGRLTDPTFNPQTCNKLKSWITLNRWRAKKISWVKLFILSSVPVSHISIMKYIKCPELMFPSLSCYVRNNAFWVIKMLRLWELGVHCGHSVIETVDV